MRVLFISHQAARTGAPWVLLSVLNNIKKNDPTVEFYILLLEDGPLKKDFRNFGVVINDKIDTVWWRKFIPNKWLLGKMLNCYYDYIISTLKVDAIFANSVASLQTSINIKKKLHVPIILYVHELKMVWPNYNVTTNTLSRCSYFIAVSNIVKNELLEAGINSRNIYIHYPSSPFIQEFPENTSQDNNLFNNYKDRLIVGISGPGTPNKGSSYFIDLVKEYKQSYIKDNPLFVWIGSWEIPKLKEVQRIAAELNIAENMLFIDNVPNPMLYYKHFDVSLILSKAESFSLVALENGLLGNPVIMFKGSCGIEQFVTDEINSFVVPLGNLSEICKIIHKLYVDSDYRNQVGAAFKYTLTEAYKHNDNIVFVKILNRIESKKK